MSRRRIMVVGLLLACGIACGDDAMSAPESQGGQGAGQGAGQGGMTGGAGGASTGASSSGGMSAAAAGGVGGTSGSGGAGTGGETMPDDDAGAVDASDGGDEPIDEPALDTSCLADITDYKAAGPFEYETAESGKVRMWLPNVPADCLVPVIHFGVDTGATCSTYEGLFTHLASHGFVAACYETGGQAQDVQCVSAVQTVLDEHPELAHPRLLGFSGHGLGGGGAYLCTHRGEQAWGASTTIAGFAMAPEVGTGATTGDWQEEHGLISSPMFIVNASDDGLVPESWIRDGYEALPATTEAYWYEAMGAMHVPVPVAWLQEANVAWFRWKLLGDKAACEHVRAMPDGDAWDLQEQQNAIDCL